MNFGLWDEEHSSRSAFSDACAALARAVADAANVPRRNDDSAKEEEEGWEEQVGHQKVSSSAWVAGRRGVSMLDLGCGCGDQLQLWAQEYNVKSVLACTPERKQVAAQHSTINSMPPPLTRPSWHSMTPRCCALVTSRLRSNATCKCVAATPAVCSAPCTSAQISMFASLWTALTTSRASSSFYMT